MTYILFILILMYCLHESHASRMDMCMIYPKYGTGG